MNKIIKKIFGYSDWGIAFRKIKTNDAFPINDKKAEYIDVPVNRYTYVADPFLFESNGEIYLFAEYMSRFRGIGQEAVAKYDKSIGRFLPFQVIITEPFHMSYPNVFKYKDEIYMLPETSKSDKVLLYKAVDFPLKWEVDKVLLQDVCLVDHSLFFADNNEILVFSHDEHEPERVFLYKLDMDKKELSDISSTAQNVFCGRGGGNIMSINDKIYRPIQDCDDEYGKKLRVTEISKSAGDLSEKWVGNISVDNISINDKNKKPSKLHSINRSDNMEVIDYNYDRFYFDKPITKILRKFNNGN